jgi:hypothetical protein
MADPEETTKEEPPLADGSDSPRHVHITFVVLAFAAGCLLLPPRQWISSGMMFGLSILLAINWRDDMAAWLLGDGEKKPHSK